MLSSQVDFWRLAVEKTVVCVFILLLNIIVFLLVFGEIIYLLFRAFRSRDFIVDTEFRAKYFFNRSSSIDRARDCLKKLTLQHTQSVLLIPMEERRLIDDIFVDLTIQIKKTDGEFFTIHSYHELYLPGTLYLVSHVTLEKFLLLVLREVESPFCVRNCCVIGVRKPLPIGLILRSCLNSVGSVLNQLA